MKTSAKEKWIMGFEITHSLYRSWQISALRKGNNLHCFSLHRFYGNLDQVCSKELFDDAILSREEAYYLVQDCEKRVELGGAQRAQRLIFYSGLESISVLADHLIRLFGCNGCLLQANQTFEKVSKPSPFTWAAIISTNAKSGQTGRALELYYRVQCSCLNRYVFIAVLKACTMGNALLQGKVIHDEIIVAGLQSDVVLVNTLLHMYACCGSIGEACRVFENLVNPSVVSWNAMIAGFSQHKEGHQALQCFQRMQNEGISPNEATLLSILKACGITGALQQGRVIHDLILESGLQSHAVESTLIHMYATCGSMYEAYSIFCMLSNCDVVSWNAMITGYSQHGDHVLALDCFERMQMEDLKPNVISWNAIIAVYVQHRQWSVALQFMDNMQLGDIEPNEITFLSLLKVCAGLQSIEQARNIHEKIMKVNFKSDIILTNLIDMYFKCGNPDEALVLFDGSPSQTTSVWNALIGGYAHYGNGLLALDYFKKMQRKGRNANEATFLNVLKACASIDALHHGRGIHEQILECGLQSNIVGNALVHMYVTCGSLNDACKVFDKLPRRDVISWNAIISGYAQQGADVVALELVNNMQQEGIEPNVVTWNSLISGYAQSGECGLAMECFKRMQQEGIKESIVTWNALIAGYVQCGDSTLALQCYERMQQKGFKPDEVTFSSSLRACMNIGAIEQGRLIHKQITKKQLQSDVIVGSTLVDMYSKCGSIEEAREILDNLSNPNLVSWNSMLAGYAQHGKGPMAVQCLEKIQHEGMKPDEASFTSILIACNRAGLDEEGRWYFNVMKEMGVVPTIPHYTSMIDLLGHVGSIREAENLLRGSIQNDIVAWTSLLNACKMHGDVEIANRCFDRIVCLDCSYVSGYVLMSNIYSEDGPLLASYCAFAGDNRNYVLDQRLVQNFRS